MCKYIWLSNDPSVQFEDQYLSSVRKRLLGSVLNVWGQVGDAARKKIHTTTLPASISYQQGCMSGWAWLVQSRAMFHRKVQPTDGDMVTSEAQEGAAQSDSATHGALKYFGTGTGHDKRMKVREFFIMQPFLCSTLDDTKLRYPRLLVLYSTHESSSCAFNLLLLSHTYCRATCQM